jgi:hypothetical protein
VQALQTVLTVRGLCTGCVLVIVVPDMPVHACPLSCSVLQGVKCMTYDPGSSTVWTGHADGSIKVHRIKTAATEAAAECSLASDTCRHGVAVTSLVIEAQDSPGAQPRCWAGDAEGRVCVRKLATLQNGQLHLLVNATGVCAGGCLVWLW